VNRFDNLGKALRLLRKQQGLQQNQLAVRAGVTSSKLSNYETGQRQPTLDSLGRLVDALGLELADLEAALDRVNRRPRRGGRDGRPHDHRALMEQAAAHFLGLSEPLAPEVAELVERLIEGFRTDLRALIVGVLAARSRPEV
jgi:transcriptional regulator with XRE-family HTH domain